MVPSVKSMAFLQVATLGADAMASAFAIAAASVAGSFIATRWASALLRKSLRFGNLQKLET